MAWKNPLVEVAAWAAKVNQPVYGNFKVTVEELAKYAGAPVKSVVSKGWDIVRIMRGFDNIENVDWYGTAEDPIRYTKKKMWYESKGTKMRFLEATIAEGDPYMDALDAELDEIIAAAQAKKAGQPKAPSVVKDPEMEKPAPKEAPKPKASSPHTNMAKDPLKAYRDLYKVRNDVTPNNLTKGLTKIGGGLIKFLDTLGFKGRAGDYKPTYKMSCTAEDLKGPFILKVEVPIQGNPPRMILGDKDKYEFFLTDKDGKQSVKLISTEDPLKFKSLVRSFNTNLWRALKLITPELKKRILEILGPNITKRVMGMNPDDKLSDAAFLSKYRIPDVAIEYFAGKRSQCFYDKKWHLSQDPHTVREIRRFVAANGRPKSQVYKVDTYDEDRVGWAQREEHEWEYCQGQGVTLSWPDKKISRSFEPGDMDEDD